MGRSDLIELPRCLKPVRDIFDRKGRYKSGLYFLKIAHRFSPLMEEMPTRERQGIYMDEIPMGYKVLYDMEAVYTAFGNGEGSRPDLRPVADFWRAERGDFVVIYEKPMEFASGGKPQFRQSHYRDRKSKAIDDADELSKAWGCKVAVARVEWLMDWH